MVKKFVFLLLLIFVIYLGASTMGYVDWLRTYKPMDTPQPESLCRQ